MEDWAASRSSLLQQNYCHRMAANCSWCGPSVAILEALPQETCPWPPEQIRLWRGQGGAKLGKVGGGIPFLSLDFHQIQSWCRSKESHCREGLWKGKGIFIFPSKVSWALSDWEGSNVYQGSRSFIHKDVLPTCVSSHSEAYPSCTVTGVQFCSDVRKLMNLDLERWVFCWDLDCLSRYNMLNMVTGISKFLCPGTELKPLNINPKK